MRVGDDAHLSPKHRTGHKERNNVPHALTAPDVSGKERDMDFESLVVAVIPDEFQLRVWRQWRAARRLHVVGTVTRGSVVEEHRGVRHGGFLRSVRPGLVHSQRYVMMDVLVAFRDEESVD